MRPPCEREHKGDKPQSTATAYFNGGYTERLCTPHANTAEASAIRVIYDVVVPFKEGTGTRHRMGNNDAS